MNDQKTGEVLAAVDFSDMTDSVVGAAKRLATALGARLTLLHVAAPDPDFVGFEAGPQTVRDNRARRLREQHAQLQQRAAAACDENLRTRALLVEGPTVATVLREAERLQASLIVVGSHGHGALYEALVGSVSEGVVRGATCPVLIVPDRRRKA